MSAQSSAISKSILAVWGAISLVGGLVIYEGTLGNRPADNLASPHDVRFVLNWCRLGENRIQKVLHSHVSGRSLTGDHLDAYAIKISHITLGELTGAAKSDEAHWYRGDQLPKTLDDAVAFAGPWLHEVPWFPRETELRSGDYYVYPWSVDYHGMRPRAAALVFIRPADKMVFYFDGEM